MPQPHNEEKKEIKKGRLKGQLCRVDNSVKVDDCLPLLMNQGNWATKNAIEIDGFTIKNAPFIYVKVDGLGYIIPKNYI